MAKKQAIIQEQPTDLKSLVSDNPAYIQFIPNPSEALQAAAVKGDVWAIKHIKNPTDNIKKYALSKEPKTIAHIEYLTEEQILIAVSKDGSLIKYLEELTPSIQLAAVKQDGANIEFMTGPDLQTQREAFRSESGLNVFRKNRGLFNLEQLYVEYPEIEVLVAAIELDMSNRDCLAVMLEKDVASMWSLLNERSISKVTKDGLQLRWLPTQLKTTDVCKIACDVNGMALEYVPSDIKTLDMCMSAVKNKPFSIQFVPSNFRTEEVCMAAVIGAPQTFKFLSSEQKTQAVSDEAVRFNGELFHLIPESSLTDVNVRLAVKQNGKLIDSLPDKFLSPIVCLCAYTDYYVIEHKDQYSKYEELADNVCGELSELLTNGTSPSAIVSHVRMIIERVERRERESSN